MTPEPFSPKKKRLFLAVFLSALALVCFKLALSAQPKGGLKVLLFVNSLVINDLSLR